jgi:2-phosphoglycerate kinase
MDRNTIYIIDDKYGLPYSKGIIASTIMATGLSPRQAYETARKIEDILIRSGKTSISLEELHYVIHQLLKAEIGETFARRYAELLAIKKLNRPIIVLLGGTTGVGKSTIAVEVAHRLAITRVVSTDSIREVMRTILSKDLVPALYESTYLAYRGLRFPYPSLADPLIIGFREQASLVAVGVQAVIDRSVREATHLVVEGIHVVPGYVKIDIPADRAVVVPVIITADDPIQHKSHFYIRDIETSGMRSVKKYQKYFENIRRIGEYIEELAEEYNFARISGLNIDTAVLQILDFTMSKVALSPRVKEEASAFEEKSDQWFLNFARQNAVLAEQFGDEVR